MKTLRTAVGMLLSILLPYLVQRWDRRRLTPEQRAATWNYASWGSALYAFGPLSMIGWAWVTRQDVARWKRRGWGLVLVRSAALLGVGLGAAIGLGMVMAGMDDLIRVLSGSPD
jgi:hypothetical protein